jgi:hypothetical protein
MGHILIRSGKDPFTSVSGESTLAQDVFNSNVGNYLFAHSVHRTLMIPGTDLVSNSTLSETRAATPRDIARINEAFDAFVVPLANAFRPEFAHRLANLTTLIEGLTIPVVVVGVGAQASLGQDSMAGTSLDATVAAFATAVLDRSASIGVRGEFTADYLTAIGVPADSIDVIGCPSLFLHGPDFRLPTAPLLLHDASRIALSVTPGVPALGAAVRAWQQRHPELFFVGQDLVDLRLILWGEGPLDADPDLPLYAGHPLFARDRVRFPLDVWTWLDLLTDVDFAIGTRLHGTIAALLAGSPGVLLTHDSRTAELAAYHCIPSVGSTALLEVPSVEELAGAYDPEPFNQTYPHQMATYLTFLERNGLEHIHQPGRSNPDFLGRVGAQVFPAPLTPLIPENPQEYAARLSWLRDGLAFDSTRHRQAYRAPHPYPAPRDQWTTEKRAARHVQQRLSETETRLRRTEASLRRSRARAQRQRKLIAVQARRLNRQSARLDAVEARTIRFLLARVKRRLARLFS